jgi:hypothetical protein
MCSSRWVYFSYDQRAYSFLFLDVDPSKVMNLEERVKEHIKDLKHHIRTNILEDVGGRVRHAISQQGSPAFTQRHSFLSQVWLAPSNRCLLPRRRNRSSLLQKVCSRMVLRWIGLRTMSCLSWSARASSFRNVSAFFPSSRHRLTSLSLFLAIINVVNFYLAHPNLVSQLKACDPKNPALEGYIYEAMRKFHDPTVLLVLMIPRISSRYRSTFPWCLSYVVFPLPLFLV